MARPPERNLRWDRVLMVLVLLGAAGFAVYWFGVR
jgi:hypothetical protein